MFSVIFEVHPKPEQWDQYLANAKMLRSELEQVDGFVDNIRYKSLTRERWILSLSNWRDEKSVVRWRTSARHHEVQEKGRNQILLDYHLRVGQVTRDTHIPEGYELVEQRLDETEKGLGTTVTLLTVKGPGDWQKNPPAEDIAGWFGLRLDANDLVSWDVFETVLIPSDFILLITWRDASAAEAFAVRRQLESNARYRNVRIVRDYGMFDRYEAPQYYPEVLKESVSKI
jgi:heme-degrading monooxygenase HmoA